MTRRGMNLIDRDPETMTRLVFHPLQVRVCEVIEEFITQLRTLEKPADYYDFQYHLFEQVKSAQERQSEASRNAKRQHAHRPVPKAPSGDWELDLLAMDRIVRQLRSVGDALAWRAFGFDRRFIIALSRNQPVSPFVGNEGLDAEIAHVVGAWC
jgi:hypothetical protein